MLELFNIELTKYVAEKANPADGLVSAFFRGKRFEKYRQFMIDYFSQKNIISVLCYLYMLQHNIKEVPICPYCNKKVRKFVKFNKGFFKTCGDKECLAIVYANHMTNRVVTQETREKLSKINKGRKMSEQQRQNLSKAMTGKKWPEERCEKFSLKLKEKFKNGQSHILSIVKMGIEAAKSNESKEKRKETLLKKYGVTNSGRLASRSPYSKVSQELFDILVITYNIDKEKVYYGTNNGEFIISYDDTSIRPDFLWGNKIIEFYGDIYHANPAIFSESDVPNPFKDYSSKEIWKIDEERVAIMKNKGYEVLVIWENDYKRNKDDVIKRCEGFLFNKDVK